MINKQLSKEFYFEVLSELEPSQLYYELGISGDVPFEEVDWDSIIPSFFDMRWEQMDKADKESYTAEAMVWCDEGGVLVGV